MTKLEKPLRREIEIGTRRYTLTIDPLGLHLKLKGHRRGMDVKWARLASELEGEGQTAMLSGTAAGP